MTSQQQEEDWAFLYVYDSPSTEKTSFLVWIELRQATHRSIYEPSQPIPLTKEQRATHWKGMKWISSTADWPTPPNLPRRQHANASVSLSSSPNLNYKLASAQEVVQDMKAFLHSFS
jgi:hypothetical protein